MTKHPEMIHFSSSFGCIKPIGLRVFKVAFCDLEACSSTRAVLRASSCARVLSLMSFWSARISSISCRRFAISFFSSSYASAGGKDLIWWNVTKARIIRLLASIAESDSRTLLSMDIPNRVKACGRYFECEPLPFFMVANCDLRRTSSNSSWVSWNMKSSPANLFGLRLTFSFKRLVSTP